MSSTSQARWRLERVSLTTATLHEAWPRLTEGERLCRVAEPIDRALVLGSSTGEEGFDLQRVRREGITVVRRHSGGGAVLVEPGDQIWLMLYLRLDDPLVLRDLGSSFLWLGTAVQNLLEGLGVEGRVVTERQERTELGRMICFADLGFGELTIGDAMCSASRSAALEVRPASNSRCSGMSARARSRVSCAIPISPICHFEWRA